jgi:hypothetical protein
VLILEITYFGVDGRPLEYTQLWYRADRFPRRNQLARRAAAIGTQAPAPLPRTAGT